MFPPFCGHPDLADHLACGHFLPERSGSPYFAKRDLSREDPLRRKAQKLKRQGINGGGTHVTPRSNPRYPGINPFSTFPTQPTMALYYRSTALLTPFWGLMGPKCTMQPQMCGHFRSGTCNLESNCRRRHSEQELFAVSEAIRKKQLPSCDVIRNLAPTQPKSPPVRPTHSTF